MKLNVNRQLVPTQSSPVVPLAELKRLIGEFLLDFNAILATSTSSVEEKAVVRRRQQKRRPSIQTSPSKADGHPLSTVRAGWVLSVTRLSAHPQAEFLTAKDFWSRMTFAVVPFDSPDSFVDALSELASKHGAPEMVYCDHHEVFVSPQFTKWATEKRILIRHESFHYPKMKGLTFAVATWKS